MVDSLKKYIILSEKSWHNSLCQTLADSLQGKWIRISKKEEFTKEILTELKPDIIFIPHWSYIITPEIFKLGYILDGWIYEDIKIIDKFILKNNIVLNAQWKIKCNNLLLHFHTKNRKIK
jgi:hypothetical protein